MAALSLYLFKQGTEVAEETLCLAAAGNMIAFLVVMLHWSRHPLISVYTTRTFAIISFKYLTVLLFYFPILIGFSGYKSNIIS
jgi:hypothetical protein